MGSAEQVRQLLSMLGIRCVNNVPRVSQNRSKKNPRTHILPTVPQVNIPNLIFQTQAPTLS